MIENSEQLITGYLKPIGVEYSVEGDIDIILSVKNISKQKIYAFMLNARSDGIEIEVKEEEGFSLIANENESGVAFAAEKAILPGQTIEENLLLNKWITFNKPGIYHVKCKIPIEIFLSGIKEKKEDRTGVINTVISEFSIHIFD
jgi:hypothetical protein